MQPWLLLDDEKLRHVWRCDECGERTVVKPYWYQDNGTPMCTDCDEDMLYDYSEVKNG